MSTGWSYIARHFNCVNWAQFSSDILLLYPILAGLRLLVSSLQKLVIATTTEFQAKVCHFLVSFFWRCFCHFYQIFMTHIRNSGIWNFQEFQGTCFQVYVHLTLRFEAITECLRIFLSMAYFSQLHKWFLTIQHFWRRSRLNRLIPTDTQQR